MTKQELEKKVEALQSRLKVEKEYSLELLDKLEAKDEGRRKEFTITLGADEYTVEPMFMHKQREPKILSWEQIFVKIGVLLGAKNNTMYDNEIEGLKKLTQSLVEEIQETKYPLS